MDGIIDILIMERTTWGVSTLIARLREAVMTATLTPEDAIKYSTLIDNFKEYAFRNNITSIGRNQFTAWWKPAVRNLTDGYIAAVVQHHNRSTASPQQRRTFVPKNITPHTLDTMPSYSPVERAANIAPWEDVPLGTPQPCLLGSDLAPLTLEEEVIKLRRDNAELKGQLEALKNQYIKVEPILSAFGAVLKGYNPR